MAGMQNSSSSSSSYSYELRVTKRRVIDTYLVPEAPQGCVSPDTAPGDIIGHRPARRRVALCALEVVCVCVTCRAQTARGKASLLDARAKEGPTATVAALAMSEPLAPEPLAASAMTPLPLARAVTPSTGSADAAPTALLCIPQPSGAVAELPTAAAELSAAEPDASSSADCVAAPSWTVHLLGRESDRDEWPDQFGALGTYDRVPLGDLNNRPTYQHREAEWALWHSGEYWFVGRPHDLAEGALSRGCLRARDAAWQ
eukprot:5876113-Prymnesium_polylepis.1